MTAEARPQRARTFVQKKSPILPALLGLLTLVLPASAQRPLPAPIQAPPPEAPSRETPPKAARKRKDHPGLWPGQGEAAVEKVRQCIIQRESGGDYGIADPTRRWFGAYQFQLGISNLAARRMKRPELIGIPASEWEPADQDAAFYLIYNRGRGRKHWAGGRYPCP